MKYALEVYGATAYAQLPEAASADLLKAIQGCPWLTLGDNSTEFYLVVYTHHDGMAEQAFTQLEQLLSAAESGSVASELLNEDRYQFEVNPFGANLFEIWSYFPVSEKALTALRAICWLDCEALNGYRFSGTTWHESIDRELVISWISALLDQDIQTRQGNSCSYECGFQAERKIEIVANPYSSSLFEVRAWFPLDSAFVAAILSEIPWITSARLANPGYLLIETAHDDIDRDQVTAYVRLLIDQAASSYFDGTPVSFKAGFLTEPWYRIEQNPYSPELFDLYTKFTLGQAFTAAIQAVTVVENYRAINAFRMTGSFQNELVADQGRELLDAALLQALKEAFGEDAINTYAAPEEAESDSDATLGLFDVAFELMGAALEIAPSFAEAALETLGELTEESLEPADKDAITIEVIAIESDDTADA